MADFDPSHYDSAFAADLVEFVGNEEFQNLFETFFVKHALQFKDDEEYRLEYTIIYQDFSALFESKLQEFCEMKRMDQSDFIRRCRECAKNDNSGKTQQYIDILLSSVEFETFVKLMKLMRYVVVERLGKESLVPVGIESRCSSTKSTYSSSYSHKSTSIARDIVDNERLTSSGSYETRESRKPSSDQWLEKNPSSQSEEKKDQQDSSKLELKPAESK